MYIKNVKNIKLILRDTAIIVLLMLVGWFLANVIASLLSLSNAFGFIVVYFTVVVVALIGFTNAGNSNPRHRWKHLLLVTLCVWLVRLYTLFFGVTFNQWFLSVIFLLFVMVLGGVLAARSTS